MLLPRLGSILVAGLLAALSSSCVFHHGHFRSHDLRYERVVSLTPDSGALRDLHLEVPAGEIHVGPTDGSDRIEVRIHEKYPHAVSVALVDDRIVIEGNERHGMLGEIHAFVAGPLDSLQAYSGAGDVRVANVAIGGPVDLETGAGDVRIEYAGHPASVTIDTGAGDAVLIGIETDTIDVDTGAGDVRIVDSNARLFKADTGVGDVRAARCAFGEIDADTGIGDISLDETVVDDRRRLSTGLGSVREI